MDGLDFQEINKKNLENEFTIGAEYYGKKYVEAVSMVKRQNKTTSLGKMWVLATDGDHGSPDYQENGVLYLLSECIKEGYIDKSKCRYITNEKNQELNRSCLHPGDIVVTKTGVYFGKSAVIPDSISEANTIAHVGKITLKPNCNPYYVSTFLNCKYGYYQLRRRGIKATRPEIKLVEFPDIIVPEYSDDFYTLVETAVYKANLHLETAANIIDLATQHLMDTFVTDLGDTKSNGIKIVSFSKSLKSNTRLDAEYFQPKYDTYFTAVFSNSNGFTYIRDKFLHVKTKCDRIRESYNYIEIGDINAGDGSASTNLVETEALPDNAKIMTKSGDLLVSTVRPNRGAVAILESDDCLVSGAFTVLRQTSDYPKEILQVLLRSDMYKDWLLRYNVGTSYPVIKDEDVLNMPIPIFDKAIQDEVIEKVHESTSLRNKSKKLLAFAKRTVEIAIEEGEASATIWLKQQLSEEG